MRVQMGGFACQAKDYRLYSENKEPQNDFKQQRCNKRYNTKNMKIDHILIFHLKFTLFFPICLLSLEALPSPQTHQSFLSQLHYSLFFNQQFFILLLLQHDTSESLLTFLFFMYLTVFLQNACSLYSFSSFSIFRTLLAVTSCPNSSTGIIISYLVFHPEYCYYINNHFHLVISFLVILLPPVCVKMNSKFLSYTQESLLSFLYLLSSLISDH